MLDTAAFAYVELGDKQTALEIYEYRIFPRLINESDKKREKYETHYSVLMDCEPKKCLLELYR